MGTIKHAVWPVGKPSIPTDKWTQQIWRNFELRFRPPDYTSGMYDESAWDRYLAGRHSRLFNNEQMGAMT